MPVRERRHRSRKLLAAAVLVLLALLSVMNFKIAKDPLWKFIRHELSFEEYVDKVQTGYLSNSFAHKNDFLNLNGLFARLIGRRTLNDVVRLNNGMLSSQRNKQDMTDLANNITDFSDYLNGQNIPFLYVQMPYKESLDGRSFPVGVPSYANENADDLLSQLSAAGVESLDLRPLVSQTQEMLEQYFYKTDHHWNADGALVAFSELLNCIYKLFPNSNIDLTYAHPDRWERHFIDNWFLGSRGKRVGIYFGGVDPLIWYTPNFETEISRAIPKSGSLSRGSFDKVNIDARYIESQNYFSYNAYLVYTSGNIPLVQYKNRNAPSPLKILMIRDSYSLPFQVHLSTIFQEIDVIDPRYSPECTIAEYVEWTEPDLVIFGLWPGCFSIESYQRFGVKEAISARVEEGAYEFVARQDITVKAGNGKNNYTAYPLEPNAVYRASFSDVDILEGATEGVGLRLYNKTSKKVLQSTIFDIAYCEAQNGFSWTFRTPDTEDKLELCFYAGVYGSTQGKGVVYRNVILERARLIE